MSKTRNKRQFLSFCLVGAFNTVMDLSMYLVLHQVLGVPTYIASPLIVFTVMSVSYILNAKVVFSNELHFKQYVEFILLTGLGVIAIQTTISHVFEGRAQGVLTKLNLFSDADVNTFLANSIVRLFGVAFSIAWNYFFYKYVVFKARPKEMLTDSITDLP